MVTERKKLRNVGWTYGAMTGVVLIAYFSIMRALGLAQHIELRLFNFVILLTGLVLTMRKHSRESGEEYNYFDTLGVGCLMVATAVMSLAVFMFVYLSLDHSMMEIIRQHAMIGHYVLTPLDASAWVASEGLSSGFIMAYVLLPFVNQHTTDYKT